MSALEKETARRRTFAIISHPDAGKTTLTEKLLLFGGAINLAGAVKSRKEARAAHSDWMAIERRRGISVTSSVMKFEYGSHEINLLDTPGHQDFSEDTYRVLTAVDSALMVIDSVKGVESQTRKLMEVCRMRSTPILTFINKLDRDGRTPLELLDDIEQSLGIEAAPLTWPIGMGKGFLGVYDLRREELRFFDAGTDKSTRPRNAQIVHGLDDPKLDRLLGSAAVELRRDVELIQGAGYPFDRERYLKGEQTPVFFGSAINNFGVLELLDTFVDISPSPRPRASVTRMVSPVEETFSGVVFKIQANMDPAHHDRIAFLRICSGRFVRGMKVRHHRLGKELRIANATIFLAQDRTGVEEAFAGDIIGLHNHGTIKIGDTFSDGDEPLQFVGIPSFAPEHFRRVRLRDPMRSKQLDKGLLQLSEEGAVQVFRPLLGAEQILGAVGPLQFDVAMERLRDEYRVDATYEPIDVIGARWVAGGDDEHSFLKEYERNIVLDIDGDPVFLYPGTWSLQFAQERFPKLDLRSVKDHLSSSRS